MRPGAVIVDLARQVQHRAHSTYETVVEPASAHRTVNLGQRSPTSSPCSPYYRPRDELVKDGKVDLTGEIASAMVVTPQADTPTS